MAYTTINKSSEHFNTILYTGDGTGTQSQTGVGFEPDMVWVKSRNASNYHGIADQVRGVDKFIYPNDNLAEQTNATDYLNSFDSDGFTHGSNGTIGQNSVNYAAWNWLGANGTASNTDGSITSTVSANTTSGFSIVSYTGTGSASTVGHGLGSTPKMIIVKNRGNTQGWATYHHTQGAGNYLDLSSTNSVQAGSSIFNSTTPTSSVFSVATSGWTNDSGYNYIAYCFAEKKGFSKFGSYVGNGSTDGTFVYTGFKPAFVLSKNVEDAGENWFIHDNTRNSFNPTNIYLRPNLSNGDGTAHHYDFHSNGFKNRYAGGSLNSSGRTYIYMAFAAAPLVGTNGVTAKAR